MPADSGGGGAGSEPARAVVLHCAIRNADLLAARLGPRAGAELLARCVDRLAGTLLRHEPTRCARQPGHVVGLFAPAGPAGARRAIAAALDLALAAQALRGELADAWPEAGLLPLAIGVGLHAGCASMGEAGGAPAGEALAAAARLQQASGELAWTVAASQEVLQAAGAGVRTGAMTTLELGAQQWLDVAEILGVAEGAPAPGEPAQRAERLREALQVNARASRAAAGGALALQLSTLKGHQFVAGEAPLHVRGFRLRRHLASGGSSELYLAVREADGVPVVLKVLEVDSRTPPAHLERFLQEYALVARIRDPHVIRILDQGASATHAYIAMEYVEGGDLRCELRAGMPRARVLEVVRQLARALEAVHAHGVIHRDLKPENVLLRADGSVVLADFGVARSLLREQDLVQALARQGQVVGTPFYLSPEQASGQPVTPATDLYSLGVMLYEMLAGERPYRGESLPDLLRQHREAPVPRLPAPCADLQPVLDRLMAKRPQDRYPAARALLDALPAA